MNTVECSILPSRVSTCWLEAHFTDPDLRIFDCTTYLHPAESQVDLPYRIESGLNAYYRGHIPGAGFLDLQGELSDNNTALRFMLPSVDQFSAAVSRHGIGEGTRVVLYSAGSNMWATRVWWMLRAFGFDSAAVLDGGWEKWLSEKRPVSTATCHYPQTPFIAMPRPALFVDKDRVLSAIEEEDVWLINTLNERYYHGKGPSRYGRPGRIPGSVNVPAATLLDPITHTFVPLHQARKRFAAVKVDPARTIIVYCGGGISATINIFLLHQLGYRNLALYDGSLGEWARNPYLPMETG